MDSRALIIHVELTKMRFVLQRLAHLVQGHSSFRATNSSIQVLLNIATMCPSVTKLFTTPTAVSCR